MAEKNKDRREWAVKGLVRSLLYYYATKNKERLSVARLLRHQLRLLRETVAFSASTVPYYKDLFKTHQLSSEIETFADFEKIPLTSKTDLRSFPAERFLPHGRLRPDHWPSHTTGSSGIPVGIYRDSAGDAWTKALLFYILHKAGGGLLGRFCHLCVSLPDKPALNGFLMRLGIKRYYSLSVNASDQEIVGELQKIKPEIIYAFPSTLVRLSAYMEKQGVRLSPKALIGTGEVLPDGWRQYIERIFRAPLYHTYGSTEFPRVGFECAEKRGYHLFPDVTYLEVLDEHQRAVVDQEGEIVLTHLNNHSMPLLRYRLGDRGILSTRLCPCGITFPLLEKVVGRMDDFLVLPSGHKVSARSVTRMEFSEIKQYKIIQKAPDLIEVLVIPDKQFGEAVIGKIMNVLQAACLGEKVTIRVKTADELSLSRTGKLQIVVREFKAKDESEATLSAAGNRLEPIDSFQEADHV
jgi:phenylacetate-CoA ligase